MVHLILSMYRFSSMVTSYFLSSGFLSCLAIRLLLSFSWGLTSTLCIYYTTFFSSSQCLLRSFFDFLQVFYIKKATLYRWLVKTRGLYVTARPLPYPVLGHKSPTSALKRVCPISATAVAIGWQNLCPSFGLPILYHVLANKKSLPRPKSREVS